MYPKRSFGTQIITLLAIAAWACLLSCGDIEDFSIDQEQTEKPLRFIEYVLFPTAPYIDKSYIEKVPEEEVAVRHIDFEVEKQAIQQVYRDFIRAYLEKDMTALRETLDTSQGFEWGTYITGSVYGWNDVKIYIQARWEELLLVDCQGDLDWELVDFYIRPENVRVPWMEASAKGPTFYYTPDLPSECFDALGRFYLTKKSGKWRIHQIDGSKYFTDSQHKVP